MSPNDIPDLDLPWELEEDIEDKVKQILTMFFLEISKIADDESLTHTEFTMLCKSNVSAAVKLIFVSESPICIIS